MTTLTNLLFLIGFVYIAHKTAYKYSIPLYYETWRAFVKDKFLNKILPQTFCDLCFITQLSLIASVILVALQQLHPFSIFMYGVSTATAVIFLNLKESN
jgi:hypothetical protein